MTDLGKLREGVLTSLPELSDIASEELREKSIEAWVLALSETSFTSLDDLTCSNNLGKVTYDGRTQSHHIRGVGRMARAMAQEMVFLSPDIGIDPDIALAGGLLHDVGKPYLYDPKNYTRWQSNIALLGDPPIRHAAYGAHIAMRVGLPEEIVHIIAMHEMDREGQYGARSAYVELVSYADYVYWKILKSLDVLVPEGTKITPGVSY